MKVAVASTGTVLEAWVGTHTGLCSQFLIFDMDNGPETDLETDPDSTSYVVIAVPPDPARPERVSANGLRVLVEQNVGAVLTGRLHESCREALQTLGLDVVDGLQGMTVGEAVARYRQSGLKTEQERKGVTPRVAIAAHNPDLDARLEADFGICTSFVVVDPDTLQWEVVRVEPDGTPRELTLKAIRAVARSGANVLITPQLHPECCTVLQALGLAVYEVSAGVTAREAVERYRRGELVERPLQPFAGM